MYQKKKFPFGYIQDLKCRVLELPYRGRELSMIVLLPDDIEDESTGLKKVTAPSFVLPVSSWVSILPCGVVVGGASAGCLVSVYGCYFPLQCFVIPLSSSSRTVLLRSPKFTFSATVREQLWRRTSKHVYYM